MGKLIKCTACEKEISRTAKACPHCGELSKAAKISQMSTGLMGCGCLLTLLVTVPIVILFLIGIL